MPSFPTARHLRAGHLVDDRQLWLMSAAMKRGADAAQWDAERQRGGWGWMVSPRAGLFRVIDGAELSPIIPPKPVGGWWFDRRQLQVLARGSQPEDVYFLGLTTAEGYPIAGVVFTPAEDGKFRAILWG